MSTSPAKHTLQQPINIYYRKPGLGTPHFRQKFLPFSLHNGQKSLSQTLDKKITAGAKPSCSSPADNGMRRGNGYTLSATLLFVL